jgi:hypothetical protein
LGLLAAELVQHSFSRKKIKKPQAEQLAARKEKRLKNLI